MICKSSALLLTRRSQQRPHQPNEPIKTCRQSTVGILKRAPKAPRCAIQRIETNGSMDHFSYPMQMSQSLQWPFRLVFYIHTSIISGLCTPHVASLPPPFKSPASARNPPSLSTKEKNSPRRIAATSIKPQTATEKKLKPNDKSRHRGPWHSAQQCHIDPIRTNCCKQRANRIKSRIHQNPLSGLFVFCLPAPDCVSRGQQLLSIANDHCFASLPPILSAPFPLKSTYLCH